MKKIAFIVLLLLIAGLCRSQEIISKEYYKDHLLTKTSTEKKGKFEYIVTQTEDGIIKQELLINKNKQKVWVNYYKNGAPCGIWKYYDKNGELKNELDYEFDLIYLPDSCFTNKEKYLKPFIPNSNKDNLVDELPMFKGGEQELMRFIYYNMMYPVYARERGIQGKVYVNFVVTKSGEIKNIRILKGVHPSLDVEAVRVTRAMPNWIPAKKNGENVACEFSMPLRFVLQ